MIVACAACVALGAASALAQEIVVEAPGLRFAELSDRQVTALRRTVKLPLSALFAAETTRDLHNRAIVLPLPDPNRPFLPVEGADASAMQDDPFGSQGPNGLAGGALAELFAIEAARTGNKPAAPSAAAEPEETNPFASSDPIDSGPDAENEGPADEEPLPDDPFADF